jgi:mono/diheme cytochrome c family protein
VSRARAGRRAVIVLALAAVGAGPGAGAADSASGRAVYQDRCSPCHGANGGGDGPAADALVPRPRNFRDPAFWKGRTREQNVEVVTNGKPGTMMAPFASVLTPAEIDHVVDFLETFRPPAE